MDTFELKASERKFEVVEESSVIKVKFLNDNRHEIHEFKAEDLEAASDWKRRAGGETPKADDEPEGLWPWGFVAWGDCATCKAEVYWRDLFEATTIALQTEPASKP